MSPRKIKTQKLERSKAGICLTRGRELYEAAVEAHGQGRWSLCGIAAVHAAISSSDGLLIQESGVRSTSSDHMDLAELLGHELEHLSGVDGAMKHLRRVISLKNRVEYEARIFTPDDAAGMMVHLERFMTWVSTHEKKKE